MTGQNHNIIEMRRMVKAFPGVRALDRADLNVRAGEIHGLVGENGAGKSTLIKILAGVYRPDQGRIHIRGRSYGALSPHLAQSLGIQFIHQERCLVPHFTVAQSIFLGREQRVGPLPIVNNRKMRREAERFMETTLGVSMAGSKMVRDLSVTEAQLVQIAKAFIAEPSIIVFDEPTAPLDRGEVETLFEVIRRLKARGITIIYISHYLQEITAICDRVTVLRNGHHVDTLYITPNTLPDEMARLMVGRELVEMFPPRRPEIKDTILAVKHLSGGRHFFDISFDLKQGEVVGLTGLKGSGREALVDTLYGLALPTSGRMTLRAREIKRFSPVKSVENGIVMVPRDRRGQGVVLDMDVNDNINLSSLNTVAGVGFVRPALARERTRKTIEEMDIRPPDPEAVARHLSGGNQQKVVVGRFLNSNAGIYLLDEPTAGIDVGAKIEIYRLINQLVSEGAGVLLISTDIPELLGTTDRILVMFRGRMVKEFNTTQATPDEILSWSTGGAIHMVGNRRPSVEMTRRTNRLEKIKVLSAPVSRFLLRYGAYMAFLAVTLYFAAGSPIFLTPGNILNVLRQVAPLAIAAFGMTAVVMGGGTGVIAGGIDLSIGAVVALVAAVCTLMMAGDHPIWPALLVGFSTALLIATVNAVMVVYVGLAPLLTTLAMMFTINGVELVLTHNKFISLKSPFIAFFAEGSMLGLPVMVVVLMVVFLCYYWLLHWTPAGIHIQTVGGSHEAAQTSAISINGYTILTYLLAAPAAFISAVLTMSRLSGSAPGIAAGMLLDIVLATYVGAAFSPRWTVNIPGTFLGALFVWILTNGFALLNVSAYWVHGVKGVIMLIVVSSASLKRKGA